MSRSVSKLTLFTLSACPMGRSIQNVLGEVLAVREEMSYEAVYVDVDHETTNRYRIKANPTTLFLDEKGQELYRFEGFKETAEVLDLLRQVEAGSLRGIESREENQAIKEGYILYLYEAGADRIVPVEVELMNVTSVKAPRITAIQQLLRTRREGLFNPFPEDASLERVSFQNEAGVVTLRSTMKVDYTDAERMRALLTRTLAAFGVNELTLVWE